MHLLHSLPSSAIPSLLLLVAGVLLPLVASNFIAHKVKRRTSSSLQTFIFTVLAYIALSGIGISAITFAVGFLAAIYGLGSQILIAHPELYSFITDWIGALSLGFLIVLSPLIFYWSSRNSNQNLIPDETYQPKNFTGYTLILLPLAGFFVFIYLPPSVASILASGLNAPLICNSHSFDEWSVDRGECIHATAVKNNNLEACGKLTREINYAREVVDYDNSHDISFMDGRLSSTLCLQAVAAENKSANTCEYIKVATGQLYSREVQYGKCLLNSGVPTPTQSTCEKMFQESSHGGTLYQCLSSENINKQDAEGNTILMVYINETGAGYQDRWTEPRFLLQEKIFSLNPDVAITNNYGQTALHLWISQYLGNNRTGSVDVLKKILASGVNTYAKDSEGYTVFDYIERSGEQGRRDSQHIIELLNQYGTSTSATSTSTTP